MSGQRSVWESLCARASIRGKTFVSGLCLAGSLIKRQTLVMILPIFILKHFRKKLAGFTTGTIAVLVISLSLAGFQGMNALLNLWLKYASAIPTNAPEKMVYQRMIGIQLSSITFPSIGWIIGLIGLITTILASFLLWQKLISDSSPKFSIMLLGTLAATLAVTWHS